MRERDRDDLIQRFHGLATENEELGTRTTVMSATRSPI